MLTNWAVGGFRIIMKPYFDVADHLQSGALVAVLPQHSPVEIQLGYLYPHRRKQDPKIWLFIDFMAQRSTAQMANIMQGVELPR